MDKVSNICEICKKGFYVKPSRQKKARYCSRKCAAIGHGRRYSGQNHPLYGKKRPDVTKRNLENNPIRDPKVRAKIIKYNREVLRYLLKGRIPHNKGKTKEDYEPMLKMSQTRKTKFKDGSLVHPQGMLGKHHTNKLKKDHSFRGKKNWRDKSYIQKVIDGLKPKPNKQEKKLIKIIKENKFPFKYVGDYKFWIEGRNPDFISTNTSKKIIEMFGDYWHKDSKWLKIKEEKKEDGTIKHYKKYGYKTLIIWESELKNLDRIKTKIKNFTK